MTTPDIAGPCERLRYRLDLESDNPYVVSARTGEVVLTRIVPQDDLVEIADTLERQAAEIERLRKAMEGLVDDLERRHRQVAEVCDEMQQQANDGYSYHRLVGKQAAYHHAAELAYQARAALTGEDQ